MPESEGAEPQDDKARCPHCQTTRLRVLNKLDRIEKLYGNSLMNRMRARRGDTIYHCVYCRLQFYDPRKPGRQADGVAQGPAAKPAAPEKVEPEPVRQFAAVAGASRPKSTPPAAVPNPIAPVPPAAAP